MHNIKLLDCTLRDGGYINNWHFGEDAIRAILEKLVVSKTDVIECGYISKIKGGSKDETQFNSIEDMLKMLPEKQPHQQYAVMVNLGEFPIEEFPDADKENPLIIRVCFKKKELDSGLELCRQLKEKGYGVYIQAMASLNYSDTEFIELIKKANEVKPDSFYIVDSFGAMELFDLKRFISLSDHNLSQDITLGYHSHNNLQQAYGNAKYFVEQNMQRDIVVDASVYGMGRGAGNLNIELFAAFLNRGYGKWYNIDPMLDIMDDYLKPIFSENFWGYSLPFYLSAQYNCHPNYANYFAEKNTLSNKSMKELLSSIPEDIKLSYSKETAEKYYTEFQKRFVDDKACVGTLKAEFVGRGILVLAPGKSLAERKSDIDRFIEEKNPLVIAVNVVPEFFNCDFLICTNEKRLNRYDKSLKTKLIITSNISERPSGAAVINYSSYLAKGDLISDNPTLMLINLLISMGIKKISIAGFDGYKADPKENYFGNNMSMGSSLQSKLAKNKLIKEFVAEATQKTEIEFLTDSLYV